jgi:hypothetical protein
VYAFFAGWVCALICCHGWTACSVAVVYVLLCVLSMYTWDAEEMV